MPSRAAALISDLGGDLLSQLPFIRPSYDLSTVVTFSRRITYGGDFCLSDVFEFCSKGSVDRDAAVFIIGDTGIGIFLMVPRVGV